MFFKTLQSRSFLQASVVMGIALIDRPTGKHFARVKDILIHNPSGHALGLLLSDWGKLKVAELTQISCIRRYDLEIEDRRNLADYKSFSSRFGSNLTTFSHLNGYEVIGEDGYDVGKLKDFYFSPRTGRIARVEVSKGFFKSMLQGTTILHTSELKEINRHRVVVKPRNYGEYLEEIHTGIQTSSGA
jgi:uncharacterized protein YrrD